MAKAASKASSLTVLRVGQVEVAVGLFTTKDKPGRLAEFSTAGPNGGVLKAIAVAAPAPVSEVAADVPVRSDPLAEDPGPEPKPEMEATGLGPMTRGGGFPPVKVTVVQGEYQRQLIEDGTGEIVTPEQVRRGVRLEDGSFIDCTEQLARIDEETRLERMDVVSFVDVTRVPRSRVLGAYYVGTADAKAAKPLRLIYEALKIARRGAVVKLTKRSRQSLGVIAPFGKTLVLYELVWHEDFREAPARALAIQQAEVSQAEVSMAGELVSAMAGTIESLDELRDDAIARRETLYEMALRGEVQSDVASPEPVSDLVAAVEASLAAVAA